MIQVLCSANVFLDVDDLSKLDQIEYVIRSGLENLVVLVTGQAEPSALRHSEVSWSGSVLCGRPRVPHPNLPFSRTKVFPSGSVEMALCLTPLG